MLDIGLDFGVIEFATNEMLSIKNPAIETLYK
jgi:hypothetical protein